MNSIINVASYIMWRKDGLNDRDIQRLCFYSQAAFLVQTGKPLFREDFVAWKTGPVCLELRSFLSNKEEALSLLDMAGSLPSSCPKSVSRKCWTSSKTGASSIERSRLSSAKSSSARGTRKSAKGRGWLSDFCQPKITILQGAGATNPVPFFCWFFCCFLFAHPDFAKIEV